MLAETLPNVQRSMEQITGNVSIQRSCKKCHIVDATLRTIAKMTENESMADHLNKFFNSVHKLNEMGIDIADDLLSVYYIPFPVVMKMLDVP